MIMAEIKLFNKWSTENIKVNDPGLRKYIALPNFIIPRTFGRNTEARFGKSKSHIVERLMGKIIATGHKGKKHFRTSGTFTGKGTHAYNIVLKSLELVEKETKENPVAVLIKAVENAAPREEITTIEYGGARYSQAVDCSPQRRVDIALRQITQGAYAKSFAKKKKIYEALADEIVKSYKTDQGSQAISKKLEIERQADSSR